MATALITGGGTGIGRATAEAFLNAGYRVIVTGRRLEPLQEVTRLAPTRVLTLTCDVANADSVSQFESAVLKNPDYIDTLSVLVNNAGIYEPGSAANSADDLWLRTFETNIFGATRMTRAFLPQLKRNRGVIVNVASNLGLRPIENTGAYSASKAAMVSWTQSLALELGTEGVRANCICPGIVDTPIQAFHGTAQAHDAALQRLQPLGRIGQPSDIAHAILSVAGPGSEWMTGAIVTVDGGISLRGATGGAK